MYNHTKQYRCTIIRGKSQKEMDNLLPAYAKIINETCPCEYHFFSTIFNDKLKHRIADGTKKTIDNHRTEIVGKLFGMYYLGIDGFVYASERTNKFLQDEDQPAFFKDVCFKMQFPNGMDKTNKIIDKMQLKISIRQFPYLLKVLLLAKKYDISLTKSDIGYYVLNSLDVLSRAATPKEVVEQIVKDKNAGIIHKVFYNGKASSYSSQHINEQINYLELANLIIVNDKIINLNINELVTINLFASYCNTPPEFDFYNYKLYTAQERKETALAWNCHFSKLSNCANKFTTSSEALGIAPTAIKPTRNRTDLVALGDEGEEYVLAYEKERVRIFNPRLIRKVVHLGKTRGLGYDIQSVVAEKGDFAEFVKYIEVKSTKRVTAPDINDKSWIDSINITRNEWIAACQHKSSYSIFRVYFVRGNVIMYVINNLHKKDEDKILTLIPVTYRVDFKNNAVDCVLSNSCEVS